MLVAVALRLLGCNEISDPQDIFLALDSISHFYGKNGGKSTKQTISLLSEVRSTLNRVPSLRNRSARNGSTPQHDKKPMHFVLNDIVWCQHGGWGFWPGKICSFTDDGFLVEFAKGQRTAVHQNEVSRRVRSFIHDFEELTKVSTVNMEGFEDTVNRALRYLASGPLPAAVAKDITSGGNSERFALKARRIAAAFQRYLDSLHRMPMFVNPQQLLEKRLRQEARAIEQAAREAEAEERKRRREEKKLEQERIKAEKEAERQEKRRLRFEADKEEKRRMKQEAAEAAARHRVPSVQEMVHNLETSEPLPEARTAKRTSRHSSAAGAHSNSDSNESAADTLFVRLKRFKELSDAMSTGCLHDVLEDMERDGMQKKKRPRVSKPEVSSKSPTVAQLHLPIYEALCMGEPVDDACIIFALEQNLSLHIIRMLLSRYCPLDLYRNKKGKTMIHIAAELNRHKAIPFLIEHWNKRQETLKLLIRTLDITTVKDYHKRSPVHSACETGAFRALQVLDKLGYSLDEKDMYGYTPLLWCASKDSAECAFYLIKKGADPSTEDKKGRSTLYYAVAAGCVQLGKTLLRNGCWMRGTALQEFVADMSLGREPHKIIFDSRSIDECRDYYLNSSESSTTSSQGSEDEIDICSRNGTNQGTSKTRKQSSAALLNGAGNTLNNTSRNQYKKGKGPSSYEEENNSDSVYTDSVVSIDVETENSGSSGIRRSTRKRIPVYANYTQELREMSRRRSGKSALPSAFPKECSNGRNNGCTVKNDRKSSTGASNSRDSSARGRPKGTNQGDSIPDNSSDSDYDSSDTDSPSKVKQVKAGRYSNRVVALSTVVSESILEVESDKWEICDHMVDVCKTTPEVIPKFVYATESYLGTPAELLQEAPAYGSYLCCSCEGDCASNPNCQCIMRNGQRSPYSDGRIDFSKGKIFECGPQCSCQASCSLRLTQKGVTAPLVVCRTGPKGFGVMTMKVILKGSFVCVYVGERVTEDALVQQENEKMRNLKSHSGFVTYAFQIHDGSERFNLDSEYIGNVARFFNHSCNPNLRPIKVVGASSAKSVPTMCFFALRRIEPGEELTWKYVSGIKAKSGQICHCDAENCVGYV